MEDKIRSAKKINELIFFSSHKSGINNNGTKKG